jgi:hypothetical protein
VLAARADVAPAARAVAAWEDVEGAEAARYELDAPRWALEPARRSCDRCDEADEAPVGRRRLGVARRTAAAEASLEDDADEADETEAALEEEEVHEAARTRRCTMRSCCSEPGEEAVDVAARTAPC